MPEYTASNYDSVLRIYTFISEYVETEGAAPSPEEIAEATDTLVATVRHEMTQLVRSGNLKRERGVLTPLGRPERSPLWVTQPPSPDAPGYNADKAVANNGRRYFE